MNDARNLDKDHAMLTRALELLPSRNVLEAAATPIYSHVRTGPGGWRHEDIFKRGFVLAERLYWDPPNGPARLSGHRLVLLVNRQLVLQSLTGTRSDGGDEWRATAAVTTAIDVLELWTLPELLLGIDDVLRRVQEPPRRLRRALRSTRAQLASIRADVRKP